MNGSGFKRDKDGKMVRGTFVDDVLCGYAWVDEPSTGVWYCGHFKENKKHGEG